MSSFSLQYVKKESIFQTMSNSTETVLFYMGDSDMLSISAFE